jgi:cyclophilin family peptidyl-prolyl cis-trans isomerase
LKQARKARPDDAVPQWLTGELLLLVGGEPEEVAPYLTRALDRGLARPRVFASLARVQTQGNEPEQALRSATKALDMSPQHRYAWDAFTRAAFNLQRFAEVAQRLERAFPQGLPDWAAPVREGALDWEKHWEAEQKLRLTEQKADDLPRVRLVIEHRRFKRDERGVPLTDVESAGKGEVVLELFEDQAPAAVAQFLTLVEQKKYDGTRFYLGEPASLVAGGDPRSRTADPSKDGADGPGGLDYYIPDEFDREGARRHFRGAISMINDGPGKTGCQFFITVAPKPELDGVFAVFGRVLRGQEVVDRVTRGRTNAEVAPYGRLIPGDLLVRAEVLRKRGHAYKVTKIQPK